MATSGTFSCRVASNGTRDRLSDNAPRDGSTENRVPAASASTDAQLIGRTIAGEPAAFGELVLRYQDRLFNSLFHVLGSAEDARDAAQDAFVQAFVKLDTFRGSSAFYTWLYRIAFNTAMSHTRRQRPTRSLDAERSELGREPVDAQPAPDARLDLSERATQVHRALAELSIEFRQVIVLREMDGCKYEEIAEMLELPVGTVRSRLFRARLELRDRLAPILEGQV
jgi:RNA polymerase sigma-70 factor (ECF subfamily)